MTAIPVFNLGKYLHEHGLSAYALAKEVQGQVPASTVYGLARKPVRRIDLPVVYMLLAALERLRGERVELAEVIERREAEPEPKSDLSHLKLPAGTASAGPPALSKKFNYSGPGKRVGLPSGTVARLISEGREP